MKKYNKTESFRKWYNGELDLDQKTEEPIENIPAGTHDEQPPETHAAIPVVHKVEDEEIKISRIAYRILSVVFCVIICAALVGTVLYLPGFADEQAPTANAVYEHYVGQGRDQTGAVNTVAGMILDYRAFDTLGESFVLFTAVCAVLLLLQDHEGALNHTVSTFTFANDSIVKSAARIIVPIILVFGVYVLFNGHLSPGGGFSGGAILGTGLILYSLAFGHRPAAKIISARVIRITTILSLSFYCLSKSYSFFTGNEFNGVHSVITPGTPGDFLSGGLILPLNLAVGLVVCCTMYTFYMVFTRGRLD
ncbi:MAG: hypothetical protein IJF56_05205 [Clostridia bacterium]|nr:hypothetical protein [Clostridia bacterium]